MGSTYTSGTSPNGALIFVPTMAAPSISNNCSVLPRSGDKPWKAMLRAARYVHTNASVSLMAKTPYLMDVPTKQLV
jgi:hypothetical protein